MYTIGRVSAMFNLPISTLRYYDKEGILPNLKRESGIRKFNDSDLETLNVIECLKRSGLEIKDIKQFMLWCTQGSATYFNRKELFLQQLNSVEKQLDELNKVRDMLLYKCWYYDTAISNGNEDFTKTFDANNLPSDIKKAYLNAMINE